jgi:thioesterase domain-containing protein
LVLIHDGGGLISSYFWLGPIGREVFGIFNPRFESGGQWEGGLPEMANAYTSLIKSVVPSGKILIGGNTLSTSCCPNYIAMLLT